MNDEFSLKKVAEILGPNWSFEDHSDLESKYGKGYEIVYFKELRWSLSLSRSFNDPEVLDIHLMNEKGGDVNILFGPIDCFHFSDEEPKVIIDSFVHERVNFLEITSEGKVHLYHYFRKDSYRTNLDHRV